MSDDKPKGGGSTESTAHADLLRRLDDEADRAKAASFERLDVLLRESRAAIAQKFNLKHSACL